MFVYIVKSHDFNKHPINSHNNHSCTTLFPLRFHSLLEQLLLYFTCLKCSCCCRPLRRASPWQQVCVCCWVCGSVCVWDWTSTHRFRCWRRVETEVCLDCLWLCTKTWRQTATCKYTPVCLKSVYLILVCLLHVWHLSVWHLSLGPAGHPSHSLQYCPVQCGTTICDQLVILTSLPVKPFFWHAAAPS